MSKAQDRKPDDLVRYLTEREASALDGMSLAWHQKRRWTGDGPPYCRIGRTIRYERTALLEWFESRATNLPGR